MLRKKTLGIFKFIFIVSLSIVLFCTQSISSFAISNKNIDEKKRITNEEGLSNVINAIFQEPKQTITQKPNIPKTSYTGNFPWASNTVLSGIFSSSSIYFSIPEYWEAKYAIVELNYSVSQLIKGVPSTLTFSINNVPFYSCEVKYVNSELQTMYAVIPTNLLKEGFNNLEVSGYVRLYDEEGCIDDSSKANWINISKDSYVTVGYEINTNNDAMLSYYPFPFMSTLDPTGAETSILVSDNENDGELTAAMFLAANLGNNTSEENNIRIGKWSKDNTRGLKNNIFIGLTENLPSELKNYINDYKDDLGENGIVLFENDNGKPMLIIVSDKEEGLIEAARMLAEKDRVDQEQSNVAKVKIGSAQIVKDSKTLNDTVLDQYTIERITDGGLSFIGPFHQVKNLYLPVSNDYVLSSEGKISLKFRYSENLDFNKSLMTVLWGDVPIASKKLSKDNAGADELTFNIPVDIVGTSAKQMSITFDLEIPDVVCTPRQMDMPWAYVTKDSSLYLPINNSVVPEFDTKPVPFQYKGSYNNVLVVLPDESDTEEYTLLGKTLAMYGKGADAYGNLEVCKASEFLEKIKEKNSEYKDKNIITVGSPDTNKFINSLNEKLYFPYNEDKTMFKSNEKLVLSDNYANRIGTMQLLKSPFKESRSVLVLTGVASESLKYIDKTISNNKRQQKLKDDCVLIDSNLDIKTYKFRAKEVKESKPTFVDKIMENKDSLVFTLASTSIMLILFLSVVLILIRNRNKNQSKQISNRKSRRLRKNKFNDETKTEFLDELESENKEEISSKTKNEESNENNTETVRITRSARRLRLKNRNEKTHNKD
jgi:hypothetical protein